MFPFTNLVVVVSTDNSFTTPTEVSIKFLAAAKLEPRKLDAAIWETLDSMSTGLHLKAFSSCERERIDKNQQLCNNSFA